MTSFYQSQMNCENKNEECSCFNINPFPTGLFYTNKTTGGGGLFVTPYVFFLNGPLKSYFFGVIFIDS